MKRKIVIEKTEAELMFAIARNKEDELLLKFLYGTGARVSEACNMKIKDLAI